MKRQTGIRIDRVLFQQFRELCTTEKMGPGEAVESLLQLAIKAGSIKGLNVDNENSGRMADDALFRSRLARLKACLELEERHLKETGEQMEENESEGIIKELAELARRGVSPELIKELETCLANADKLFEATRRSLIEEDINETKLRIVVRESVNEKKTPE